MLDLCYKYRLIILFVIALVASMTAFNPILKIAKLKNLADIPDSRKIQKVPTPVVGGLVVFFGIAVGLCFYKTMVNYTVLFPVLGASIVMLYVGSIDDMLNINPSYRFFIEICVALLLVFGLKTHISDFQGLWGISHTPLIIGILLSVITFVGVINSINMIDGIDGLSSVFCIMILGFLGIACFLAHFYSFAVLSAVSIGALVPFMIHNVYGKESKMFIGDGGTLMMGTIISAMIFVILGGKCYFPECPEADFSRIAFVLAVLAIPVADTLRVMFVRIINKKSPFLPDKNHLHHILIQYGFPHSFITFSEVGLNLLIIAIWFIVWCLGSSVDWQLYSVVISAILLDWGTAALLKAKTVMQSKETKKIMAFSSKLCQEKSGFLLKLQGFIDGLSK